MALVAQAADALQAAHANGIVHRSAQEHVTLVDLARGLSLIERRPTAANNAPTMPIDST